MYLLAFLYEVGLYLSFSAYIVPTNRMAPTLRGPHFVGECPYCHKALVVSCFDPSPLAQQRQKEAGVWGICASCRKISKVKDWNPQYYAPDRFLSFKWIKPQRWDLVVFLNPQNPKEKYVNRLVGLPGEEVIIKEGAVWINKKKLTPPKSLAKQHYSCQWQDEEDDCWGSPANPARLAKNEYFFLGDFYRGSFDSRFHKGVPAASLEGVAILIYWPPARWSFLW